MFIYIHKTLIFPLQFFFLYFAQSFLFPWFEVNRKSIRIYFDLVRKFLYVSETWIGVKVFSVEQSIVYTCCFFFFGFNIFGWTLFLFSIYYLNYFKYLIWFGLSFVMFGCWLWRFLNCLGFFEWLTFLNLFLMKIVEAFLEKSLRGS